MKIISARFHQNQREQQKHMCPGSQWLDRTGDRPSLINGMIECLVVGGCRMGSSGVRSTIFISRFSKCMVMPNLKTI